MLNLILILIMVLIASRSDDHFVLKLQKNYQCDVTANDLEALISPSVLFNKCNVIKFTRKGFMQN